MPDRLTAPWSVKPDEPNYIFRVETADGFPVVHVHHQRPWDPNKNHSEGLTREQARAVAVGIARIPDRQWPADVKAALLALQAEVPDAPRDFDSFVQMVMRDALIAAGKLAPYVDDGMDR
ncbi:hypothetical protein [Phenylobacterium immobile]|uniref:hypothetical protein n=1 Tax=Phenylobacterium immobile TaxID=21 RepID=UPI000A576B88|nr:hypothetical protein [Phenylobacterium immobile]